MLPDELTLLDGTEVVTLRRGLDIAGPDFDPLLVRDHIAFLGGRRYYRRSLFELPACWRKPVGGTMGAAAAGELGLHARSHPDLGPSGPGSTGGGSS